jgi:predicted MFS family arabinose efflux permease
MSAEEQAAHGRLDGVPGEGQRAVRVLPSWFRVRGASGRVPPGPGGLLRQPGFALLCTGQGLSMLADWGLRTLLLVWVYQLTHAGLAVSIVGLAEALPLLLLAPLAGVYVDRWSRAQTMAGACVARAALLLPLFAVASRTGLPVIVLVALLASCAALFFQPAAAAVVPAVVGAERAGQANSLLGLLQGGVSIVAPGLAAGLYSVMGPHATLVMLCSLYLLAVPFLRRVPAGRPAAGGVQAPTVLGEMLAGLRYVLRSSFLGGLLLCAVVFNLGAGALSVLDVVFVTRALHLRPEAAGILLMANGLGALTGGVLMTLGSTWVRQGYHRLLGVMVLAIGAAYAAYALAPSLVASTVAVALVGLAFIPALVSYQTIVQLASDDAVRGRVLSIFSAGIAAGMLASLSCAGALIDLWGVRAVIGSAAALILSSGLLCWLLVRGTPATQTAADVSTRCPRPVPLAGEAAP